MTLLQDVPVKVPFSFICGCQFFRKPRKALTTSGVERVRVIQRCRQHVGRRYAQRIVTVPSASFVMLDHLALALRVAFQ